MKQHGATAMPNDSDLLMLAQGVLRRNRDRARDSRETVPEPLSHAGPGTETVKTLENHNDDLTVSLSHALGSGTMRQAGTDETARETRVEQHYGQVLTALRSNCPEMIDAERWQQAIRDAEAFLNTYDETAHALGWTARDLFGLHSLPPRPSATYQRLSRYDATGLIWLLRGRSVIALSEAEAAIQAHGGGVLVYRKHRKPALGPIGDSLDDLGLRA